MQQFGVASLPNGLAQGGRLLGNAFVAAKCCSSFAAFVSPCRQRSMESQGIDMYMGSRS